MFNFFSMMGANILKLFILQFLKGVHAKSNITKPFSNMKVMCMMA
jgi:2-keto-3-deoxy-6-phosphogluconate aldolase